MRILIDFTQIPLKKVGVGVYALNLITWITKLNESNVYYILIQSDETCFNYIEDPNIRLMKVNSRIFRIMFFRIFLEQIYTPILVLKNRIDIIHSLHYSFPLISFGAKRIVTIHDLTFFIYPNLHILIKRYYFKLFTFLSVWFCDKIITVSNSTKVDLIKLTKADSNKIQVIYLGRDEIQQTIVKDEVQKTLIKYNIDQSKKYILFIGTIEPRKNISKLIMAFNSFIKVENNYQLVIVGRKGWHYRELLNMVDEIESRDDIIFTGFVNDNEKYMIISESDFFIYPSIYEGFGIPILESLSFSKATITSNISSMPEVAGDAAILIDPTSEEEILSALLKLANDSDLKKSLILKCDKQVKQFSWEKTANLTIELYNSSL